MTCSRGQINPRGVRMLLKIAEAFGLNKNQVSLRRWRESAERINQKECELLNLSDEKLKEKAKELSKICYESKKVTVGKRDSNLEEVFSVVREASRRILGLRHFDVQLIGAMALHEGKLAEMKTGEGKSLCLTLAAIYNAMCGLQTHVVTVNEYLAKRDAQTMSPLYSFFGLEVGLLTEGQELAERRNQYSKDVVYGVNHEFGFDYLRHNMAQSDAERRMIKGLGFAIVDEVDSILIDEARTPLIISGSENDDLSIYQHCWDAINLLKIEKDLEVDEKQRNVILSEYGFEKLEHTFIEKGIINGAHHLYDVSNNAILRAIQACLSARFLFHKDKHYIVRDGKVMIVDENTGRLMADRRWSNGIHQAVECKEGVEVKQESKTMATITYQNFFRLYERLSGLTGTAMTQATEFYSIYGLETFEIPTHRPTIRIDQPDVVYRSEKEKFMALAEEAKKAIKDGRPVLAGTSNIEESEKLSEQLTKLGVEHRLLNAKNHELEAQIIEEAGLAGRMTVATNMAGRGTDIVLGGHWLEKEKAMLESNASAEEIEEEKKKWNKSRENIIKKGGLLVLGCARNESRRVDNQLRGRSGRQGDPGESKFFISLDDDLFRVYAQTGILAMIDKYNMMPEGSCLEHPMLNRSLDKAQAAVENHHFEMRKQLQEYDGVGAAQRRMVYSWRDGIIDASEDETWATAIEMIQQALDQACEEIKGSDYMESWESQEAKDSIEMIHALPKEYEQWANTARDPEELKEKILKYWVEKLTTAREKNMFSFESIKAQILDRIDDAWQEHLTTLQNLLDGIHLRSYAQKDPKQEYKREGYEMFGRLRGSMVAQCASAILTWVEWVEKAHESVIDGLESENNWDTVDTRSEKIQAHWLDDANKEKKELWSDGVMISENQLIALEWKTIQKPLINKVA